MKKIAMFGGTFDPIHKGHIGLAVQTMHLLHLDKVLLIPTNIPPHKQMHAAPGYHRLAMCKLAVSGIDGIEVSDRELRREGPSYTVDTLRELKAEYPDSKLFLIMGSDMFFTLEQWRESEEIMRLAVICTGARERGELDRLKAHAQHLQSTYQADCQVLDIDVLELSSTEIREKYANGVDLSEILPAKVLGYIRKHHLYTQGKEIHMTLEEITQQVQSMLKPKRFQHSCNVARLAKELAQKYGADPDKAYLAGIIHDTCKNLPDEEQFTIAHNSDIIWDNAMMNSPQLWHAPAGVEYARDHFGISDEEILSAVRYHTTGRAGMGLMEKILFVADLTSDDREYPGAKELQELARKDLDAVLEEGLAFVIQDLSNNRKPVHLDTVKAYNEIVSQKLEASHAFRP